MSKVESVKMYIERLSALPPRKRLEEWRAIADPVLQKQVAEGLPPQLHAEMMGESAAENLNRNVLAKLKARKDRAA